MTEFKKGDFVRFRQANEFDHINESGIANVLSMESIHLCENHPGWLAVLEVEAAGNNIRIGIKGSPGVMYDARRFIKSPFAIGDKVTFASHAAYDFISGYGAGPFTVLELENNIVRLNVKGNIAMPDWFHVSNLKLTVEPIQADKPKQRLLKFRTRGVQ